MVTSCCSRGNSRPIASSRLHSCFSRGFVTFGTMANCLPSKDSASRLRGRTLLRGFARCTNTIGSNTDVSRIKTTLRGIGASSSAIMVKGGSASCPSNFFSDISTVRPNGAKTFVTNSCICVIDHRSMDKGSGLFSACHVGYLGRFYNRRFSGGLSRVSGTCGTIGGWGDLCNVCMGSQFTPTGQSFCTLIGSVLGSFRRFLGLFF